MAKIKQAVMEKKENSTSVNVTLPQDNGTTRGGGLRFNKGKLRYDLLDPDAVEGIVKVLTYGLEKYTVTDESGKIISTGANNWKKGMDWSSVIGSLKRHLAAIEKGEDYDFDKNCPKCISGERCDSHSGLLHIDHLMCNGMFLSAFYKIFPQGDDRKHKYLNIPPIGLDIDDVLANFTDAWIKKFNLKHPKAWKCDRKMMDRFAQMESKGELHDFYLNLEPLMKPEDLPFEPKAYITSRSIPAEITEQWLDMNGYPTARVISVGLFQSKVQAAKEAGVEVFVDDSFDNFKELNKNGITCFLFDAIHNGRYDVGHKRIKKLTDLPWFKK
jgi:hypothetical protein